MKKLLLLFVFLASMLVGEAHAQINELSNDTASNKILNELQIIRSFHEETRNQRQRAVEGKLRRDSINNRLTEAEMVSDLGIMARIEDNTHPDRITDGWNLYGFIAILIAIISAVFTGITYRAQRNTERNTKRISQDMQRYLLFDLIRRLYRNFIITYTMRTKMEDIDYNGYPSEEHYMKLKIPMEDFHLDTFYGDEKSFEIFITLWSHTLETIMMI